jgi:hypothetical protein
MIFNEFDKYCIKFYDTNLELNRIYSTYTIVLLDYKLQIESIFNNLLQVGNRLRPVKNIYEQIDSAISQKEPISDAEKKDLFTYINSIADYSNEAYSKLSSLNIDIQNSLEFLFGEKIEKPENEEFFFSRI